jgi:hypothetical protein
MCPAALISAGATPTGGVAAVLLKKPTRPKAGMKAASLISTSGQKEKSYE